MRAVYRNAVFGAFLLSVFLITGYYFAVHKSFVPEELDFAVDIEMLRTLAGDEDRLPIAINCLITGEGQLIDWTILAGDRSVPTHYVQTSFQIRYRDKTFILDAPMGEEQFAQFRYGRRFLKAKHAISQKAIDAADLLILTHEHWDHVGGLAKSPHLHDWYGKAVLTQEQLTSPMIEKAGFPAEILGEFRPLDYDLYHQAAPGIIVIKAPGHTPGHQMVYVRLQRWFCPEFVDTQKRE